MIEVVVKKDATTDETVSLPDNEVVETMAKDSLHHLRGDTQERLIRSITFPATSTTNVIKILPKAGEDHVDTQGFTSPIVEKTITQGGLEGRTLTCPQALADYTQTRWVVTPPDATSFGNDPDELERVESEWRKRPFIKLKVTVKHS